jgi:peptide/nickel transport system permease protein
VRTARALARLVGGRVLHGTLVLWGVSLLTFLLLEIAPGRFLDDLRLDPRVSPQTIEALRVAYGLDRPLHVRYLRWLAAAARGDLGYSYSYNIPASALVWERAGRTLALTATATLLSWLAALALGLWCAAREGGLVDRATNAASALLLALPDVVVALGLLAWAVRSGVLPVGGMTSVGIAPGAWAGLADRGRHVLLPVLALTLIGFPVVFRHVRSALVETLRAPFLRATRAHGVSPARLLLHHALPAAAPPLLSLLGLSVAGLLSASLLVEVVMSWPGLGALLLEAVLARDIHLVLGAVLLAALFLLGGNLLADLLLFAADPRIRRGEG